MKRAVALALGLAGAALLGADDAERVADPPLCREVIERRGEQSEIEALTRAETERARAAHRAHRESQKLMRTTLGGGRGAIAHGALQKADAAERRRAEATREGKVLCYCRHRRGDPLREDCEALYPVVIP